MTKNTILITWKYCAIILNLILVSNSLLSILLRIETPLTTALPKSKSYSGVICLPWKSVAAFGLPFVFMIYNTAIQLIESSSFFWDTGTGPLSHSNLFSPPQLIDGKAVLRTVTCSFRKVSIFRWKNFCSIGNV